MRPSSSRLRLLCLATASAALAAVPAGAQTMLFGFEGGQRTDAHVNGIQRTGYFGGMNVTMVLGGGAGRDAALLFPVSGEFRWSNNSYMDLNAFGDVALRLGPVTAGAGLAFSFNDVPDVPDAVHGGSSGKVVVINPMSFGLSGSAKLSFGPQGRAFVQGRITRFPADYAIPFRSAEAEQARIDHGLPTEDVLQRDSHSLRLAAGYAFAGKVIRLQYMDEDWQYERTYDNRSGAYDRRSRVLALGVTFF